MQRGFIAFAYSERANCKHYNLSKDQIYQLHSWRDLSARWYTQLLHSYDLELIEYTPRKHGAFRVNHTVEFWI